MLPTCSHLHPTKPFWHLVELPILVEDSDHVLSVPKEGRLFHLVQENVGVPATGWDQTVDIIATLQKVPDLWIQKSSYMGLWGPP